MRHLTLLAPAALATGLFLAAGAAQAQTWSPSRNPNAAIGTAMTEAQARAACRKELGRRTTRAQLDVCLRQKMVGGN